MREGPPGAEAAEGQNEQNEDLNLGELEDEACAEEGTVLSDNEECSGTSQRADSIFSQYTLTTKDNNH